MKKNIFLIYLFSFFSVICFSQSTKIDSLLTILQAEKEDTNKVNTLNDIAWELRTNFPDSAILYNSKATDLSKALHYKNGLGVALHYLSVFYRLKGDYSRSLENSFTAIKIFKQLNDQVSIASCLGNIGISYSNLADYPNALHYYFESLKVEEKNGLRDEISGTLVNIGVAYRNIGNIKKALDYYLKALAMDSKINNKRRIAVELGNIATINYELKEYEKGLEYCFRSLKMYEELDNRKGCGQQLANIGLFYRTIGDSAKLHSDKVLMDKNYALAFEFASKALDLSKKIGDKKGTAANLGNQGDVYYSMKNFSKAEEYLLKGLSLSDSIGTQSYSMEDAKSLSNLYVDMKKHKLALSYFKKYIELSDLINNEANTKKQTQTELQYEFDKKTVADSIKNEAQLKQEAIKHTQEIQQQKIYTFGGLIGLLLMLIVAIVSFRAYRQKQQANEIIIHQKELVEVKQKEILDSIYYARRIQKSLLPTEKYFDRSINRLKKFVSIVLLFFIMQNASAQQHVIDSLLSVLKIAKQDTNRVNVLNDLGWEYKSMNDYDKAKKYVEEALLLSTKINFESGKATANQNLGNFCYDKSKYDEALLYYLKSLEIQGKIKNKKGVASAQGSIGLLYWAEGDYAKSLDYNFKALKIAEATSEKMGMSKYLGNIGLVYKDQGDYPQALNYYFKSLKLLEILNDQVGVARLFGNIGVIYYKQSEYDKALEYYFKALKMEEGFGNKIGIGRNLGNIGIIYKKQKVYPKALDYYFKALKIAEELNDKPRIINWLGNISNVYQEQGDSSVKAGNTSYASSNRYPLSLSYNLRALKMAEDLGNKNSAAAITGNIGVLYVAMKKETEGERYLKKALEVDKKIGALNYANDIERALSDLYEKQGKDDLALLHYKAFIASRDSLFNEANTKKMLQTSMQYEFDKKTVADSIRNAEQIKQEELKNNQEIQQQKTYTYGGLFGFVLMVIVAAVSFRAYRQKQLANEIISHQKELVEEKQKEILDSIYYARRIQKSLLPTEKYIEKSLNRLKRLLIILFISTFHSATYSQSNMVDSMLTALKKEKDDTNKVNTLNDISWELKNVNPDSAIQYSTAGLNLAEKIKWKKGMANSFRGLGTYYRLKGSYPEALTNYLKGLKLAEELKDKNAISACVGNMGIVYRDLGDYSKALQYYFQALKMAEEMGNQKGMVTKLGNIGLIYFDQADYSKAFEYYSKALKIAEKIDYKEAISNNLGNIALLLSDEGENEKALPYFLKAIKIDEELGNNIGVARHYGNIGILYHHQGDSAMAKNNRQFAFNEKYPIALTYYFKALKMDENLGNKNGILRHLGNIGGIYISLEKYREAEKYLKQALVISNEINAIFLSQGIHSSLSTLYEKTGQFDLAISEYKKYIVDRDSVFNEKNTKRNVQTAMQYEFDKKAVADSLKNAGFVKQEELKHNQEIKLQKNYMYGGFIGFILMIIVAAVSFRAYRQKQLANKIISHQKELVEEKQKEILDSIYYARRIQNALLPTNKYISKTITRLRKS